MKRLSMVLFFLLTVLLSIYGQEDPIIQLGNAILKLHKNPSLYADKWLKYPEAYKREIVYWFRAGMISVSVAMIPYYFDNPDNQEFMSTLNDYIFCYNGKAPPIDILVNEIDSVFLRKKDEGLDFGMAFHQAFLNIAKEESK